MNCTAVVLLLAVAQPPDPKAVLAPPAAAPAAIDPAVVAHLQAWEAKHKTLTSLNCEVEEKKIDRLKKRERSFTGSVMCMKPNLAWMNVKSTTEPNFYQAYISDGNSVFEYESGEKTVTEHKIAKANGVGDNLLIEFMSGSMTAQQALQRFDIRLEKAEQHYVYLQILPRLPKDLQDFSKVRLVLYTDALKPQGWEYLPAAAVITSPTEQFEEQWTFKNPTLNHPNIKPDLFKFKDPGPGWTRKLGPSAVNPAGIDPKVARPAGTNK
jgi:TIGR03009 family protein